MEVTKRGGQWRRLVLSTIVVMAVIAGTTNASPLQKRNAENQFSLKDKRPFCNAFTGCGRKRSSGAVTPGDSGSEGGRGEPEGGATYENGLDTRAELDELARHVLAQARLWEQLQNKVELMRSLASGYPEPAPAYRRKREATILPSSSSLPQMRGVPRTTPVVTNHKRQHRQRVQHDSRTSATPISNGIADESAKKRSTDEETSSSN